MGIIGFIRLQAAYMGLSNLIGFVRCLGLGNKLPVLQGSIKMRLYKHVTCQSQRKRAGRSVGKVSRVRLLRSLLFSVRLTSTGRTTHFVSIRASGFGLSSGHIPVVHTARSLGVTASWHRNVGFSNKLQCKKFLPP